MANYFQTDDRDDYFNQFSSNKVRKPKSVYNISINNTIILTSILSYKGVTFTKTLINKTRRELRFCWKEELERLNYKVEKITLCHNK